MPRELLSCVFVSLSVRYISNALLSVVRSYVRTLYSEGMSSVPALKRQTCMMQIITAAAIMQPLWYLKHSFQPPFLKLVLVFQWDSDYFHGALLPVSCALLTVRNLPDRPLHAIHKAWTNYICITYATCPYPRAEQGSPASSYTATR